MRRSTRREMAQAIRIALCATGILLLGSAHSYSQLVVNRADGSLTFSLSESAEVKGYSIASENGLLNPETWSSLADQAVEGWFEANPRNQMLTELNPGGFVDPAASAVALGNAYQGTTMGLADEDLTFQYILSDASVVDGSVDYTGPINDLVLRVDAASGAANLELLSANVGPFDVIGYSIFSDSGSLAPGNLTGLGEGWSAAAPTANAVAELSFEGSKVFETNTVAQLGNIFTPGSEQDLRFEFATLEDVFHGSVTYGEIVVGGCDPNTLGDINGSGTVDFQDFLVLADNFGSAATDHTTGDVNCNGTVDFPDFLILAENFGASTGGAAAASVPEPRTGLLALLATLLLACVGRKRVRSAAAVTTTSEEHLMMIGSRRRPRLAIVGKRRYSMMAALIGMVVLAVTAQSALAQVEFSTRMIVLDPDNPGPNAQINNTREARDILRGFVTDVNIAEDVTGTVDLIDFAGNSGALTFTDYPYPNGVAGSGQNDFTVQVTGFLEIPEGDYTIGFNTDDGGLISMPRVNFLETFNENGEDGTPGEIIYNGTRGFSWTYGHFTVPAGETLRTEFEAIMFERGGGDGFEVAHIDSHSNDADLALGLELGDDTFGWKLLENGPGPGDFNWDDKVDFADFLILADNFGTGRTFAEGDNNGDFRVDLVDFGELFPLLTTTAPAATSSVPEPSSLLLLSLACLSLSLPLRRRLRG